MPLVHFTPNRITGQMDQIQKTYSDIHFPSTYKKGSTGNMYFCPLTQFKMLFICISKETTGNSNTQEERSEVQSFSLIIVLTYITSQKFCKSKYMTWNIRKDVGGGEKKKRQIQVPKVARKKTMLQKYETWVFEFKNNKGASARWRK